MIQFYFLSIFFNAAAGYALISEDSAGSLEIRPGFSLKDETVRLILGVLCAVTGVLKLLSVVEGDIPIIGDLVPAAAGFIAGFSLIFEYYRGGAGLGAEAVKETLFKNRKFIGILALAAAALHFLFPKVLLL